MQIDYRAHSDLWIVQENGVILAIFETYEKAVEFVKEMMR